MIVNGLWPCDGERPAIVYGCRIVQGFPEFSSERTLLEELWRGSTSGYTLHPHVALECFERWQMGPLSATRT